MIGPEGVIDLIADRLEGALPAKIAQLRARLNLDDPTVTDPNLVPDLRMPQIMREEPEDLDIEISSFPAVWVMEKHVEQTTIVEKGQYVDTYQVPYIVNFLIYVRDDTFTTTKKQSRRMALAVRETILALPQLADGGGNLVELVRDGWSEQFGMPGNNENVGIIAGSNLQTVWVVKEQLPFTPGPEVHQIFVDPRVELMS